MVCGCAVAWESPNLPSHFLSKLKFSKKSDQIARKLGPNWFCYFLSNFCKIYIFKKEVTPRLWCWSILSILHCTIPCHVGIFVKGIGYAKNPTTSLQNTELHMFSLHQTLIWPGGGNISTCHSPQCFHYTHDEHIAVACKIKTHVLYTRMWARKLTRNLKEHHHHVQYSQWHWQQLKFETPKVLQVHFGVCITNATFLPFGPTLDTKQCIWSHDNTMEVTNLLCLTSNSPAWVSLSASWTPVVLCTRYDALLFCEIEGKCVSPFTQWYFKFQHPKYEIYCLIIKKKKKHVFHQENALCGAIHPKCNYGDIIV
jgi:hypothetical protein